MTSDLVKEVFWRESLFMRKRALGDAYWGYLLRAFAAWGFTWFLLFGCPIFLDSLLGRTRWFNQRGMETIMASTAFGVTLRLILEMFPRDVTCTASAIVVNHGNYYRRKVPAREADIVISPVGNGLSRLTINRRSGRAIPVGIPDRYLGEVTAMLGLQI